MLKFLKGKPFQNRIPFILFIIFFIVYLFTSGGRTPFDYFTRLASSFLDGKVFLTEKPPWLSELIPAGTNKFYVVYPPMPAILSMPFVFLFGDKFEQQFLAHALGAGIAALTYLISMSVKKDIRLALWSSILVGAGTIIWFLSATGSSWYLGQISAAFFLTAGIYESLSKKRAFLIGIFLGAAFLSRLHIILSLPLFLYLLFDKKYWFKRYLLLGLGMIPFIALNFYYNFVRFGVVWDKAYFILPQVLNELDRPWFSRGVMNAAYIPDNIRAMFWSFPKIIDVFPYIQPSWAGLSIWITTPAFVYAFFAPFNENLVKFSWLTVFLIFAVVASHGGTGWAQFGYRFAVDFYPILIFLVIKGAARMKFSWHHWLLLAISVLVNLWGVILINKFGVVSF